jgi:gluconate 2-dehydrogenase gamma chain
VDPTDSNEIARRSFLRLMGGTLGATFVGLDWSQVATAAHHAAAASVDAGAGAQQFGFLSAADAADVEAIAAQIVPSGATPGARDAGVVYFIDRGLATFYAHQAGPFRARLDEFRAQLATWRPGVGAFATLAPEQQIEFLHTVDRTPFFRSLRQLTVLGLFSIPAYGGNRDGAGWKLLGFVDQHAFEPPFGYYDRDYPGFDAAPGAKP